MNVRARKKSQLALCLIFIMIFTSFSSFATATGQAGVVDVSLKETTQLTAQEKISTEVQQALEHDQYVEVLIKLTEQVDSTQVAEDAQQSLSANATDFQKKMQARYAVVDALSTTAKQSQQDLLKFLEQEEAKGTVRDIQSFYIVNIISATVSERVIEELSYRTDVQKILFNETIQLELPERTVSLQEEMKTQNDNVEWNIDRVEAPAVWDTYGVDGSGIVVGMIDSGAHWQHEALKEKWRGYDPANPDQPNPTGNWFDAVSGQPLPYDLALQPHGTHVMGTILGQDPAGQNKIGVAPGAKWIAARAFTEFGGSSAHILASAEFMLAPTNENGQADPSLAPDIVNNSWGGGSGLNEWFRPMVEAWRAAGILPVFAAGNTTGGSVPGSVSVPSNYPESFAVGATDINNLRGNFSNQGPGPYEGDVKPDIAAPGVNIRSAVPGGYEAGWNGTSMAAPHVAGAAALLLSLDSSLTVDDLEEILIDSAIPTTDNQYPEAPNYGYGHGLLNVFDAVSSIASGRGVITGSVLIEGSDHNPAVIDHNPIDDAFAGLDVPISATITDDVAVSRAELWVKQSASPYWIVIPMSRTSGDHQGGVYEGTIPWMFVDEPGFTYQIKAVDYGRNLSETEEYSVDVIFGVVPDAYSQDFSEYPIGWVLDGDWDWGVPTVGPEPLTGDKLVATNLSGNYSANSDSQLLLPPLDLRNTEEASLRLDHWYDIELNFDEGVIAISDDFGETWEIVESFTGRDQQWRSLVVDLNAYAGSESPVFAVFAFFSDNSVHYPGWYIDQLQLVGVDEEAPDAPTNLEANVGSAGVHLSWTASTANDIHGYNIYRSENGGELEQLAQTSGTSYSDAALEGGTEYTYVVTAYDYSDNESEYSNEVTVVAPYITLVYSTDFEENDGGFTTGGTNNSWAWGVPTSGPNEAASGERLWATNLSGNYPNSSNSYIESPTIDLSGLESAELTFAHWFSIENNYDFAYVRVSADGGETWDTLATYTNRVALWDTPTLSLEEYVGEEILIRFVFTSDNIVAYPGWYVDDVTVVGTTGDTEEEQEDQRIELQPIDRPSIGNSSANQSLGAVNRLTPTINKELVDKGTKAPEKELLPEENEKKANDSTQLKVEERLRAIELQQDESGYVYTMSTDKEELEMQLLRAGGLPVDAYVTVLETGRTVRTNPADGTYRILHPSGSWTLQVESYGYYTQTDTVELGEDETVVKNFLLDPVPRGDVQGQVINERNGEPIEGASVRVVEDARIPTVETEEDGSFTISNVIEGSYTLDVRAADYISDTKEIVVVGGETTEVLVQLKPFIGYDDEIAYDDGTAENARAFYDAGNGWAVRMTPDGTAQVRGASVYLWGADWPIPGADTFSVAVYDSQPDGSPGEMVIAPVVVEGERGGWNYVDLSEHGFTTDQDFYVVAVQVGANPNTPGVGMDENGPFSQRSYMVVNGAFQPFDASYGNAMVRASVGYSLDSPVILSPAEDTYTNESSILVEGTVTIDSLVTLYRNGEVATTVQSEDGAFSSELDLVEGENVITATATIDAGETDPSAPVTVVKDTYAPQITILSPADGTVTNREVINVHGVALDDNLDTVTVNGQAVNVSEVGEFSQRVILDPGENVISVVATDLAGNETTKQVTVHVSLDAPDISDIQPAEDQYLAPNETLEVSFHSSAHGGSASFYLTIPLTGDENVENELAANRIQMTEVEPGYYVGTWNVTPGIVLNGAVIEIELVDAAGNRATAVANGKVFVNSFNKVIDLPDSSDDLLDDGEEATLD
ncbi:S8 family serine peptidase [Bacillus horti]|uniref:Bacillopeptidase F n=1 Tax=Caldalkalibacillus horti TaxID=77523 RepID=A0ABT9VZK7_9BACI|nr:S8 family serine peptidase [Bacillus horti]MDQ0166421.1 bacillopeptidase F [Bacillus horti]